MGARVSALVIPVCVAINVLMLYTKTTRVLNVDIWNLWHHAFTGSLVTIITDSLWLGIFAAGINCIITMVIADRTSGDVEKYELAVYFGTARFSHHLSRPRGW